MRFKFNFIVCLMMGSFVFSDETDRFVSIGGCVTETLFAIGVGEKIVAVDQSSTLPKIVKDLPQVGYIRSISSEGILSMLPTQIFTTTDIGPPNVIKQLGDSGVKLHIFDSPYSFDGILNLITSLSKKIDMVEEGNKLKIELLDIDSKIKKSQSSSLSKSKMVFFMNPGSGSYNAAGGRTKADYLINYIGGENIFNNQFKRYSKVSKEDIIKYNPDVILIGSISNQSSASFEKIFIDDDDFKIISAVNNKKIFVVDMGEYLSFGPSFVNNASLLINRISFDNSGK
tara:strand:- start:155 stop:1009 length:855 start_codon:yes stop_codon:yes gene_type:complete